MWVHKFVGTEMTVHQLISSTTWTKQNHISIIWVLCYLDHHFNWCLIEGAMTRMFVDFGSTWGQRYNEDGLISSETKTLSVDVMLERKKIETWAFGPGTSTWLVQQSPRIDIRNTGDGQTSLISSVAMITNHLATTTLLVVAWESTSNIPFVLLPLL